jgi:hypothetical protein
MVNVAGSACKVEERTGNVSPLAKSSTELGGSPTVPYDVLKPSAYEFPSSQTFGFSSGCERWSTYSASAS